MKQSNELLNDAIDEAFIIKRCHELLTEVGIKSAPIDPVILASCQGISGVVEEDMVAAGMLIPGDEKIKIVLRKKDSTARKRFTCCHEIVHTFFPDFQKQPQMRTDSEVGRYDRNQFVEYLCDFGAAELLMPSFLFIPLLNEQGFNVAALQSLSNLFNASCEATAIKMVKSNPSKYAMVVWVEKHKPSEKAAANGPTFPGFEQYTVPKKLRVHSAYGFEGYYHIPKDKSLEESVGIIAKAFKEEDFGEGEDTLCFGSKTLKCSIGALYLPGTTEVPPRVITLLERT